MMYINTTTNSNINTTNNSTNDHNSSNNNYINTSYNNVHIFLRKSEERWSSPSRSQPRVGRSGHVLLSWWIAMSALKHQHVLFRGYWMIDWCIPLCVRVSACVYRFIDVCVCECVRVWVHWCVRKWVRVYLEGVRKKETKTIIGKGGFLHSEQESRVSQPLNLKEHFILCSLYCCQSFTWTNFIHFWDKLI